MTTTYFLLDPASDEGLRVLTGQPIRGQSESFRTALAFATADDALREAVWKQGPKPVRCLVCRVRPGSALSYYGHVEYLEDPSVEPVGVWEVGFYGSRQVWWPAKSVTIRIMEEQAEADRLPVCVGTMRAQVAMGPTLPSRGEFIPTMVLEAVESLLTRWSYRAYSLKATEEGTS